MKIYCLCPTYGRPRALIENTLACFLAQDYTDSELIIFDDGQTLEPQRGKRWRIVTDDERLPSLPAKYNWILGLIIAENRTIEPEKSAVCVWDDDDVYLPWHLSQHAKTLQANEWSHPREVWSTYVSSTQQAGGRLAVREPATGRFHGSLAIRWDLMRRIGGWIMTRRADFDQQQIAECERLAGAPGRPDEDAIPSYVFRWADSGAPHCQGEMRTPDDLDWYDRVKVAHHRSEGKITEIRPCYDASAKRILDELQPGGPVARSSETGDRSRGSKSKQHQQANQLSNR